MSSRWSLSNLVNPVHREQFINLAKEFLDAAQDSFGTECSLEVTLMKATKATSSYGGDNVEKTLKEENEPHILLETKDLAAISEDLWKKTRYAEASIRPIDKKNATESAWAHLECGGIKPKTATYYIQCERIEDSAKKKILANHWTMIAGDGWDSNSVYSTAAAFDAFSDMIGTSSETAASIIQKDSRSDIHHKL